MTSIGLCLGNSLDVHAWSAEHRTGQVPDRWPYGLDHLIDRFDRVTPTPQASGVGMPAARVLRRLGGGYDWAAVGRVPDVDLAVAWDERAGVPLAVLRADAVLTGVIWLTEPTRPRHWTDRLASRGLQRSAAVWALSSAQLPVLRDVWEVSPSRLHHLPFGVDRTFWTPGGRPEPGRVLVVGNDRHRDHPTAIASAQRSRRAVPQLRLHLVTHHEIDVPGEWATRTAFLPHAALREQYRSAQVCAVAVLPNLHCSGITAALEAMACARPVVVSDTPGMRDYVDHGVNGLLVPPGDIDAMAAAMTTLMLDPDRADELGRAGRLSVQTRFNTESQADALARIIDGVA